jgi:hypothetical protein
MTSDGGTGRRSGRGSEDVYYIDPEEVLRILVILKDTEL